jgi:hypothetical protein
MKRMFFALSALTLVIWQSPVLAQTPSSDELTRRNIERRAFEAVVWGMPAVNYDLMLQEMLTKTNGKVGQVIYWGRPLDSKNQTLTPNPDALYFMAFYNTKDGPIVLDLPPADAGGSFNANIVTVWQMPLEDVGLLGIDKGKSAKILIVPPAYNGTPPEGYIARQSDTFGGYMLFGANLKSHSAADRRRGADVQHGAALTQRNSCLMSAIALGGHPDCERECPLSVVKQTPWRSIRPFELVVVPAHLS